MKPALLCLPFILLGCCLSPATLAEGTPSSLVAEPVRLVADDWCPQHCEGDPQYPGYVVEIVGQALALRRVPYSIVYQPWLRAMKSVESGAYDGLLTPTEQAYAQYLYPQQAVGYQDYCFYVRADDPWQFQAYPDLLGKRLAYLQDSGFGALGDYIAEHRERIVVQEFAGGQGYTRKLFDFLRRGRTDLIIMTSDVYQYAVKRGEISEDFRSAGCLGHEKMVVGLSAAHPERSRLIAEQLDAGIAELRRTGQLERILGRYGMPLWRDEPAAALQP